MVVEDLRGGIAELPGRDDLLHSVVEVEKGVEGGRSRFDAPSVLLGLEEVGGAGGTRIRELVRTGARRDEAIDRELVDDWLDPILSRHGGIREALKRREALDPDRS